MNQVVDSEGRPVTGPKVFHLVPRLRRRLKLLSDFGGTLILIAIIIAATLGGIVPLFRVTEAGSTPIKQVVLGMAVVLFALTSIYTMGLYFQNRRYSLYWYSLGLALTCIGLVGITVMKAVGGPVGWAWISSQTLFEKISGAK